MAPGLLPSRRSRASRCVLCLAVSAAAVLGPASWTYAAERAPGGAAHRAAGPLTADVGTLGALAPAARSAERPGTATGSPTTAPTATAPPRPATPAPTPPAPASRPSAGPSATASASPSAIPSGSPSALPSGASGSAGPPSGSAAPPPAGSSASPSASADRSPLAGRPAGEGRARPGRSLSPLELARADALLEEEEEPEADLGEVPPAEVTPSAPPGSEQSAPQALDGPAVRQVQEVSLGAGIALVGMGLGFLAFRMRRVR